MQPITMKNQRGYVIQIVLIVFAIIMGLMLFPIKFPEKDPRLAGQASQPVSVIMYENAVPGIKEDSMSMKWFKLER